MEGQDGFPTGISGMFARAEFSMNHLKPVIHSSGGKLPNAPRLQRIISCQWVTPQSAADTGPADGQIGSVPVHSKIQRQTEGSGRRGSSTARA